jgi:hypothetical protein
MPLPMVHLAIAVRTHELIGSEPTPAFLLGSIAPDAIHMRPNTTRSDKQKTHLLFDASDLENRRIGQLLGRYRARGPEALDFAEGYVTHVFADRAWTETVPELLRRQLPAAMPHAERRSLYYQESDQVDFDLYHEMPWRPAVWGLLAQARPIDFELLLTADEIARWRDRTLDWFESLKQEPMIEPAYVTAALVQAFILETAGTLAPYLREWKQQHISS